MADTANGINLDLYWIVKKIENDYGEKTFKRLTIKVTMHGYR